MKTIKHQKHKKAIKKRIRRDLINAAWASIINLNPNVKLLDYLYDQIPYLKP